jgi:hypothetical protein
MNSQYNEIDAVSGTQKNRHRAEIGYLPTVEELTYILTSSERI